MGNRIVVMKDGLIQQISDPLNLYNHPVNKFVAGFIGSPPMNFIEVEVVKQGSDYFVKNGAFTVAVKKDAYDKVKDYEGKKAIFGFRPEDLIDENIVRESEKRGTLIKAKVEVIEPLGSEIFLYLSAGKDNMVVRVPSHYKTELGKEVGFVVDLEKTHLFDIETEQAIY